LAVLHFVFLYLLVTEGSNKKFKTDYGNLVHVFLSRVGGPDWGGGVFSLKHKICSRGFFGFRQVRIFPCFCTKNKICTIRWNR
jgi:hypothetical protein